ncbi:hypothetical protein IVA79_26815 [Bradyrhizobium sp. 138]|uniref:hypothetical protein n=1 Tax=Bradyrhizobium sp. 138 TaxID=2782615 RepID=UPI001FF96BCF|nr:hypothetical protein [Bradyrhizobium sp. 138]MCK1737497.1 hypothetical protein [Bradyrhizobium sp. 138]
MHKLASSPAAGQKTAPTRAVGPADELPPEYWRALLDDPSIETAPAQSGAALPLSQISEHLLRLDCRRCGRTLEIQKADAVRLYGPEAVWRDVGQRLLDNTCTNRTGSHEDDGCWPSFG